MGYTLISCLNEQPTVCKHQLVPDVCHEEVTRTRLQLCAYKCIKCLRADSTDRISTEARFNGSCHQRSCFVHRLHKCSACRGAVADNPVAVVLKNNNTWSERTQYVFTGNPDRQITTEKTLQHSLSSSAINIFTTLHR